MAIDMNHVRRFEDGFSLVEALVAFAVLAVALLAGFRVFGDGINRISEGQRQFAVLEVLRAQLADQMTNPVIVAGMRRGSTEGVAWVVTISMVDTAVSQTTFAATPWKLRVEEDRPGGTPQVLETIFVAPRPQ